ncbi:hypothetical protein Q9Q94_03590 [Uliginosibacterium sp. 31-16]|uniref:hypothetical protein n=1 Tax=Uliginosibacterium sp. 31-16 TaxID=3068315 RepID=UPI00273ED96A|nr:hypothetical protein [Uliginosibacterium sp. 31-16]MDP5238594.1 hypothetical protein [Uliginosibacterium sp. 31-16]
MNRTRRFFLYAWRFNALVILLIGLGALALIGIALIREIPNPFNTQKAQSSVVSAGDDAPVAIELLSQFEIIPTRPVLRARFESDGRSDHLSGYKHGPRVRDYLFVDTLSRQSWWLRGQAPGLIRQTIELGTREETTGRAAKAPVAVLYLIVDRDTSGDNRFGDDDEAVLALSDAEGHQLKALMPFTGEINKVVIAHDSPRHAMLLYTRKGELRLARISLDKQTIEQDGPLNSASQRKP